MSTPYLLHYAPDNASLIVRLALEEMGVPYRTRLVDRAARAQASAAYRRLNPAGRIPTLETPDGAIFETGAILLWLADRHGALAPAPADPARGRMLTWLFFIANTLHPAMIRMFYAHRYGPAEAQAGMRAADQYGAARALRLLDGAYPDDADWLMGGDAPGLCDLYLAPILRWCALYPEGDTAWFALAQWPRLARMVRALEPREATRACVIAEGLGPTPFSAPRPATPPEGTAT